MCCIPSCIARGIALTFKLINKGILMVLYCVVGCTVLAVMTFAICLGLALGYNYSLAQVSSNTTSPDSLFAISAGKMANKKLQMGSVFAHLFEPIINNPALMKYGKKVEKQENNVEIHTGDKQDDPIKFKIHVQEEKTTNELAPTLTTTQTAIPAKTKPSKIPTIRTRASELFEDYDQRDKVDILDWQTKYAKRPLKLAFSLPSHKRPSDFAYTFRPNEFLYNIIKGTTPKPIVPSIWSDETEIGSSSTKTQESVIEKIPKPGNKSPTSERSLKVLPLSEMTTPQEDYEEDDSESEASEKLELDSELYDEEDDSNDDAESNVYKTRLKVTPVDHRHSYKSTGRIGTSEELNIKLKRNITKDKKTKTYRQNIQKLLKEIYNS